MTLRSACGFLIASLWGIALCGAANPVYTNKPRFRIPYRYDAAEMQRLGAKEIRLYLSIDRGAKWSQAMAVSPDTGRFDFEAAADGEHWFAVRTIDSTNRMHPQGNTIEPELKVVVDTAAPTLDLRLRQPEPGRVELSWSAADPNLNVRELRLESMQPGQINWQPITILPKESGQIAWNVPQGGTVAVRGTVADMAGNVGQGQNQLRIDMGAATRPRPGVPDLRQPVADGPSPQVAESPFDVQEPATTIPRSTPAPRSARPPMAINTPTPVESPFGVEPPSQFVAENAAGRPETLQGRYPDATATDTGNGSGTRTRLVNNRRFQIGYQLEDVGPSGVSAVELFITEDNGQKWYKYGVDPDTRSPFEVEVPRDGAYGFSIRVKSGAGLATDPPQPNDAPSIVVVCDQIAPQVQVLPPQQGKGEALDKVLIRWKVTDEHPHEKPVSLAYAAALSGPWQPIATSQPNTGSYVWTVAAGVPARVYIRVIARDAAGNVAKADTPEAVVIDLTRPTARIVDVEASDTAVFPR